MTYANSANLRLARPSFASNVSWKVTTKRFVQPVLDSCLFCCSLMFLSNWNS